MSPQVNLLVTSAQANVEWLAPGWLLVALAGVLLASWLVGYLFFKHAHRWKAGVRYVSHQVTKLPHLRRLAERHPKGPDRFIKHAASTTYLVFHLVLGLSVSVLSLIVFHELAESVVGSQELDSFDHRFAQAAHEAMGPGRTRVMLFITDLGSPILITIGAVLVAIMLAFLHRWRLLLAWTASQLGGGVIDLTLKNLYQRQRPSFENPIVHETTWSFPSGHTMGSLLFYGMLTYFVLGRIKSHKRRALLTAGAATLVAAIALSRVLLGAHYVSDVAAGLAAGIMWLLTCITATETIGRVRDARKLRAPIKPG